MSDGQGAKPGLLTRAAGAVGGFVGRVAAEASAQRALAERPTGRLDHTWSARNSATSPAYEAAAKNRANADWRAGLTSATLAIVEGLDVMLARSRWMIRNDGYAASAQGGYRRRVVGTGITARSAARDVNTGAMLKDFNRKLDVLWNAWALAPTVCDVEQTKSLYEKQALWMDELFAAGGVLLNAVYTPRTNGVGLAIQELEYEQLNRDLTSYGGNAVFNGIETDAFGAPVRYHVFGAAHPLEEKPSASMQLDASRCRHLFRKNRVRQRLGAPMMAAVLPAMRNLAMYELYTIGKARTEASYHGFVTKAPGSGATIEQMRAKISGKTPDGEVEDADHLRVRVENGLFPVLPTGETVEFPPPGMPNSTYDMFVNQNLRKIAAGTGLDQPTIARWYADGNFNTQRAAALEMEAETDAIRDLEFINGALRWIRGMFVEIAVREGKLQAAGFGASAARRAAYLTTNWQGPPRRTVDPIKDQAAWDMRYRSLRGTPQDYYNENGRDVRDVLAEWEEFLELVAEKPALAGVMAQYFNLPTINAPKTGMQPDGSGPAADPADAEPNAAAGGNGKGKADLTRLIADRLVQDALLAPEMRR